MSEEGNSAATMFRQAWHVYGDVLAHNYMFHREICAAVNARALAHAGDTPVAVLELGCGDASQSLRALAGLRLAAYSGCDLSPVALDQARTNLAASTPCLSLECRDMLDFMAGQSGPVDIVYSSFALHHLDSAGKRRFFAEAGRLLGGRGVLILADVVRDDGQAREPYLDAYMGRARALWQALSAADLDLIDGHVREYDLPETLPDLCEMGRGAGFSECRLLACHTWHAALVFSP